MQRYRCVAFHRPYRYDRDPSSGQREEQAMPGLRRLIFAAAAATALACSPVTPAAAGGHGFGHGGVRWGLGRGLFGAAAALVTLPIVIASAAVSAIASAAPAQPAYAPPAYAPAPAYPSAYYAPRPYYAPPAPAYYAAPAGYYSRGYYPAPQAYYAPRPAYSGGYAVRGYAPRGYYGYPPR
jgi:hypothetical protein